LFIFSFSSDLNFFTKCSGFYFFIDTQSDIQFLSSSSLLNIVWFSTKVLLSLSDISFILNIFGKKWIPIKFDIRVTKYVFIKNVTFRLCRTWPNKNAPCWYCISIVFWNGCDI
jgi:hypothetical protein